MRKTKKKFLTKWEHGAIVTSEAMRRELDGLKEGDFVHIAVEKIYCSGPEKEEISKELGLSG